MTCIFTFVRLLWLASFSSVTCKRVRATRVAGVRSRPPQIEIPSALKRLWPFAGRGAKATTHFEAALAKELDVLYINQNTSLPLKSKIVVVGAGPSGLHMAAMLSKKGYTDITILEKTDRVGGKSYTLYFKEDGTPCSQRPQNWDGTTDWSKPVDRECRPVEQGTCFLHSGYHFVRNLNAELGLTPELPPAKGPMTAVTALDTQCVISEEVFPGLNTSEGTSKAERFDLWGSKLMEKRNPGVSVNTLGQRMSSEVLQYIDLHEKYFKYEDPSYTFPKRISKEYLEELSIPFEQWLVSNGLKTLPAILSLAQAAQGYGYLNDVPAYYGMLWITPTFFCGLMQYTTFQMLGLAGTRNKASITDRVVADAMTAVFHVAVGKGKCKWSQQVMEGATMLPEGYASIWKRLYEKELLGKIDFLVDDLSIHRKMDETHPVKVSYSVPSAAGVVQKSREFDFLIYSGPARAAYKYIKDSTPFERKIFAEHWTGANLVAYTYKSPPVPSYSDKDSNYALLYFPDRLSGTQDDGKWYQDNSGHIFASSPDFSHRQIRRSLQYYSTELGDVDQQIPATQAMQAAFREATEVGEGRREAMLRGFRAFGQPDSEVRSKVFTDLKESMAPYIPEASGGIDAVDFMDSSYSFPWPYFSRFTAAGLRLGRPWDAAEAQGDPEKMPATWYVGGSMVFESVNDIIGYNLRLLRSHSTWSKPFQSAQATYGQSTYNSHCLAYAAKGLLPKSLCHEAPQPPLV